LGFKWSAITEATDEDALASVTSSLVELQADKRATEAMEKRTKRRLDMVFQMVKINF
jgi:hypothetical protein